MCGLGLAAGLLIGSVLLRCGWQIVNCGTAEEPPQHRSGLQRSLRRVMRRYTKPHRALCAARDWQRVLGVVARGPLLGSCCACTREKSQVGRKKIGLHPQRRLNHCTAGGHVRRVGVAHGCELRKRWAWGGRRGVGALRLALQRGARAVQACRWHAGLLHARSPVPSPAINPPKL